MVKHVIMKSAPKTCSLDPIPTPLLLEILYCLLPSLTALINSSLSSGLFPQVFKSAVIFPLLKKSSLDPNELKNFRPISNLPFISKIIEKLVLVQISHHLSANNLLNQFQSAYRPGHSTEQIAARFRPFWYSLRLVFIISFWSNPIGLCSLAYICASIGILRCSTRIGFGSYSFRVIHYTSLCCHRTSFDPPSFIRRRHTTPELCYSGSPS